MLSSIALILIVNGRALQASLSAWLFPAKSPSGGFDFPAAVSVLAGWRGTSAARAVLQPEDVTGLLQSARNVAHDVVAEEHVTGLLLSGGKSSVPDSLELGLGLLLAMGNVTFGALANVLIAATSQARLSISDSYLCI